MKLKYIVFSLFVIAACYNCSRDDYTIESRDYPSIDTQEVTDINENGATLHGHFLASGTSTINDYGFVYDDEAHPQLANAEHISFGASIKNDFSGVANRNLTKGKPCYFRTYAVAGTKNLIIYGEEKSFISQGGLVPTISSLSPSTGRKGDIVLVIGSGFSEKIYRNQVYFGNLSATVTKCSPDTLYTFVPNLLPGDVNVKVIVHYEVNSNQEKFTVIP